VFRKPFFLALLAVLPLTAAQAEPRKADSDGPSAEKKICRTERATGSYFTKRICHTKAEWDALEARSTADLDRTRAMERSRSTVGTNR